MAVERNASVIDSTQRLEWEVTKEEFDSCPSPHFLSSPVFKVHVGDETSKWQIRLWPNGHENNNRLQYLLELRPGNVKYSVQSYFEFKSFDGKVKADAVEELYGNKKKWKKMHVLDGNGSFQERIIGKKDSKKDSIRKLFMNNSRDIVKVVATVVIYVDGEKYVHNRELATNFMANHRSITDLEMLSDFTIVCGGKQFKCHRLILASMSTIFKTMLTNKHFTENTEHMVEIVDSTPDIVEAMLYFMTNGVIPRNINDIALDLIHLAEKYDLQDLMKACERSLANNITVEKVIDTLVTLDLYNPASAFRKDVIQFIKSNVKEVTKTKDWTKFVQNYPSLVTEVVLSMSD